MRISEQDRATGLFNAGFQIAHPEEFDFNAFQWIRADQARGRNKNRLNEVIIMVDTETSKSREDTYNMKKIGKTYQRIYDENLNYIVKWSIAINALGFNLGVIWGSKPTDLIKAIELIHQKLPGDTTIFYIHNLAYDYVFIRKFCFDAWGPPVEQLATRPHYPINIKFENGIILRDSLILSQRKIEKWAEDLNVAHKKAVGLWDYNKIRNQRDDINADELTYICNDVLAGVECISETRRTLRKTVRGLPYTATGIPRNELKERGKEHNAHREAVKYYSDYTGYKRMERIYHGGYTHANRNTTGHVINNVVCYDFSSSYPYCLLAYKFPMEKFTPLGFEPEPEWILERSEEEAFFLTLEARNVELINYWFPMPPLQLSKVERVVDANIDNGRILEAGYINIQMTEIELYLFLRFYKFDEIRIYDVEFAAKDYLPRWVTDYIYQLYIDKTKLKGVDPILYNIQKAKLNSMYGIMVQKMLHDLIEEDYETGDYTVTVQQDEAEFNKAVKRQSTFLFYAWGLYVTAYATRNLFHLGSCARDPEEDWLYSDTDSCYFKNVDPELITIYNNHCKELLSARGYGAVIHNGREYWLGVAELDGEYSEFLAYHSKCYAARDAHTDHLKITVAGVPKKTGAKCLKNDIENFKPGFIFKGEETGKLTHVYNFIDGIRTDAAGNEIGDSINLIPCDYMVSVGVEQKIDNFLYKEIEVQVYDEEIL